MISEDGTCDRGLTGFGSGLTAKKTAMSTLQRNAAFEAFAPWSASYPCAKARAASLTGCVHGKLKGLDVDISRL
jgi:hypothetical protein